MKSQTQTQKSPRKTVAQLAKADNASLTTAEWDRKFPNTAKAIKREATNADTTSRPAKASQSAKASPKAKGDTPIKAKQDSAPKPVFALVAGTISQIMHKGLKQAIAYHVAKGNLERVDAGIKLTAQGATLWKAERIERDPARFHEVAAFVNGGDCPKEWKGQPVTANAAGTMQGAMLQMPNMLYWGSFSSSDMRRAFASLWARKV